MGTTLRITPPSDFDLPRDVCSYGYFLLAPNHWDPAAQALIRPLELTDGASCARLTQPRGAGTPVRAAFDRSLARSEQHDAREQIARMLRLTETEQDLAAFHRVDPRWQRSGQGRLFRSPTLFEDIIKTVTSCNVAWPSTINMNRRMCDVLGRPTAVKGVRAFPSAAKLARTRPGTLRARCRVGYRDQRMIDLAKLFAPRGKRPPELDAAWFEDPANDDDTVFKKLLSLPGIGPYAAGNIMQLLGRYSRLAIDTESVRHARVVLGYEGTERELMKRVAEHYEPFGEHRFRSYWFELWEFYEKKRGPAHEWDREGVGASFTASQLQD
ncbi:MAG: hypothetical protein AAGG07_09790 [Planctomycetota bacterium]